MKNFSHEVSFRGRSQNELEKKMASLLRRCGWICEKGGEWLRPFEVRDLYGISSASKMTMQLLRFKGQFPTRRGASGRILRLQLTKDLSDYLERLNRAAKDGA